MIEALGLAKDFNGFEAVSDVTLSVAPGELVVLLGPNGAGKTTTVRMLAAILKPTRGRAIVAGYDVAERPETVRREIGLLTEFPGLYDRMTAMDYLDFFGAIQGMARSARRARAEELLRRFDIWEARRLRLGDFSKGMRQKVALVRALLHDPPVLLLDEPTSAMDPASARLVRECLADLREAGRTLFVCTHNLTEAEILADRIAIIRMGRIVALDTPHNLRRQLLGQPLMEVRLNGPGDGLLPAMEGLVTVVEQGANWFRYHTPEPERSNPQVLALLAGHGAEVITLSEVTPSLEEIYLQIVSAGDEALSETAALLQRREGRRR